MHPLIRENQSLRAYNTFGIDVRARFLARFSSVNELRTLLEDPVSRKHPRIILGGGSNVLFRGDFDGLVLRNELRGIELLREDDNHYYVEAAAGENWHAFVTHCVERGWAGVENLSLIPGSVGAGPMQNIGAYGVEICDVIDSVLAMHVEDLHLHRFTQDECSFGYRESCFKRKEKDRWVILSVQFRLMKRPVFHTRYGSIQEELDKMQVDQLSIRHISEAVIRIRRSKLPDPEVLGNAGSFFKNPVISQEHYQILLKTYSDLPSYPVDESRVKVPAGWLIERAGWKGYRSGKCGVHERQALVLVNYGGATGPELVALSEEIQADILRRFQIELEREVNLI